MKIICLGDSLTFGYEVPRKDNWVSLAAKASGHEFINRGINGDTTGGMLARFYPDVLEAGPAVVILMGGGNDIMTSGTDIGARANLAAMVHQAASRAVRPIVAIPPPLDTANVREDWARVTDFSRDRKIAAGYADWIRHFAEVFGVWLIDFYRLFLPDDSQSVDSSLYIDGLHPTAKGHQIMAGEVARFLSAQGLGGGLEC